MYAQHPTSFVLAATSRMLRSVNVPSTSGAQHTRAAAPRCTRVPTGAAARLAASVCASLPSLETARLVLRAPETRDFDAWARIFADDVDGHIGGPMDAERAWYGFTGYVAGWLLHGHGMFAVERKDTRVLVGFVTVGIEFDDYEPELGWLFASAGRGQGFATEAAQAARAFAIETLGEGAFVSYIDPANISSQRVASRLGAVRDPVAEKIAEADGVQVWRHAMKVTETSIDQRED